LAKNKQPRSWFNIAIYPVIKRRYATSVSSLPRVVSTHRARCRSITSRENNPRVISCTLYTNENELINQGILYQEESQCRREEVRRCELPRCQEMSIPNEDLHDSWRAYTRKFMATVIYKSAFKELLREINFNVERSLRTDIFEFWREWVMSLLWIALATIRKLFIPHN